eukprot:6492748-Amphidinium_carterae.2
MDWPLAGELPKIVAEPICQPLSKEDAYPEMLEDIQNVLSVDLPRHRLLKVKREGIDVKLDLCSALLGAYSTQGVGICRHTRQEKYRAVLHSCHRLAKLRTGDLSCPYTSISLNQGAFGVHTDNNYGDTVVLALGSYTGGELRVGDTIVDGHMCWVRFNGSEHHEVLPYKGHRRSISLFITRRWPLLTQQHALQLQAWGFDCASLFWPPSRSGCGGVNVGPVGEPSGGRSGSPSTARVGPKPSRRGSPHRLPPKGNFDSLFLQVTEGASLHFMTFFRVGIRHIKFLDRSDPLSEETGGHGLPDSANILPCGLPYKHIYLKGWSSQSGRRVAKRRERFARRAHWVNQAVAYLTWLAMRRPRGHVHAAVLAWELTPRQRELCDFLWSRFSGVCRPGESIGPLPRGGLSSLYEVLGSVEPHDYSASTVSSAVALELTPNNMSLPEVSAQVPLEYPVLPPELVHYLRSASAFRDPECDPLTVKMPPHFMCCDNWLGVGSRLVSCGLAEVTHDWLEPSFGKYHLRTGLFGVAKADSDLVRLIVDRRRANMVERSMRAVTLADDSLSCERKGELLRLMTLPHASQFLDLVVPRGGALLICLEDARDFFYLLQLPEVRVKETMLGLSLSTKQLFSRLGRAVPAEFAGEPTCSLLLRSPAMGDQKSVDVAQSAHTHSLLALGALHKEQWMTFGFKPPGRSQWQGAYVDDYCQVTMLPGKSWVPGFANGRQKLKSQRSRERVYGAYKQVCFQRKESKSVVDQPSGVVWGGELSSERLDLGGPLPKVKGLVRITMSVVRRKRCAGKHLQRIVGFWTHHMMFRRCGLALFDRIYAYVNAWGKRRVCWLPHFVLDELYGVCLLWPLLRSSLSAHLADCMVATDATLDYGAVCHTQLSLVESLWAWQRCPRRAGAVSWVSLDPLEEYEVDAPVIPDPFMECFANSKQFVLDKKYRFKVAHHINVQEAIAWRTSVKLLSQHKRFDSSRIVFLVDSLVLQSVVSRGRSRSRRLNRVASSAAAFLLFADIYPLVSWVRTHANPADDPTRHVLLRGPVPLLPPVSADILSMYSTHPWVAAATWSMWKSLGWKVPELDVLQQRSESDLFDATLGYPGEGPGGGKPRKGREPYIKQDLRVRVQPATALRYRQKLSLLENWLANNGFMALSALLDAPEALVNQILSAYLQFLHVAGRPTQWGTDTLAAIQFAGPSWQGRLRASWAIQRQWCRITPFHTRTPLPLDVLLAMVTVCMVWNWPHMAASLLVGFHLLLRPGELAGILRRHLLLPCDLGGLSFSGSVSLPKTKTSNRGSKLQSVLIEDALVLNFLDGLLGGLPPVTLLVAGGLPVLSKRFDALKSVLGLQASPFTLASLRGGGAVHYMRTVGNVSWLQYRGRWESAKSMGHYLQAGSAMLAMVNISEQARTLVKSLAQLAPNLVNNHHKGRSWIENYARIDCSDPDKSDTMEP